MILIDRHSRRCLKFVSIEHVSIIVTHFARIGISVRPNLNPVLSQIERMNFNPGLFTAPVEDF